MNLCFFRYSITDKGCALAEKLETVTGDSSSPVSTGSATTFVTDSIKSTSHASIDLTSDRNSLSTADVSRRSKLCIDFKEKVSDLDYNSNSNEGFTRITERKEEELKPARYKLERGDP